MTDSSDSDSETTDHSIAIDPSTVPTEIDWELLDQIPFGPDEPHDITTAVIEGVAEAEGVRQMEIRDPPLYEIVDAEALQEALLGIPQDQTEGLQFSEFMYQGYRIVVRSDGWVQVFCPLDG